MLAQKCSHRDAHVEMFTHRCSPRAFTLTLLKLSGATKEDILKAKWESSARTSVEFFESLMVLAV